MDNLPTEIRFRLLEDLDAQSLSARCSTDRGIATLCTDSVFWRQKVRSLDRRTLQKDWLMGLAEVGDTRLLNILLNALADEEVTLDDRYLLAAIWTLTKIDDNTGERLYEQISGSTLKLLGYRYRVNQHEGVTVNELGLRLKEEYALVTIQMIEVRLNEFPQVSVPDFWHVGTYLFVGRLFEPYLDLLPSPSAILMVILNGKWDKAIICLRDVMEHYLIPHLCRKNDIESLRTYARDLVRLEPLTALFTRQNFSHGHNNFYSLFIGSLIYAATVEQIDYVLDGDWNYIANDLDMAYCENADTFREIARRCQYDDTVVNFGYVSMEYDEWLQWFIQIPSSVLKQNILEHTALNAREDGYTDFANKIDLLIAEQGS